MGAEAVFELVGENPFVHLLLVATAFTYTKVALDVLKEFEAE